MIKKTHSWISMEGYSYSVWSERIFPSEYSPAYLNLYSSQSLVLILTNMFNPFGRKVVRKLQACIVFVAYKYLPSSFARGLPWQYEAECLVPLWFYEFYYQNYGNDCTQFLKKSLTRNRRNYCKVRYCEIITRDFQDFCKI